MVVKPHASLARARKGLAQPGVKVRGREHLWITFGADYTPLASLDRPRKHNLGHERSMAVSGYALGSPRRAVARGTGSDG